jgi:hypothetical protein
MSPTIYRKSASARKAASCCGTADADITRIDGKETTADTSAACCGDPTPNALTGVCCAEPAVSCSCQSANGTANSA